MGGDLTPAPFVTALERSLVDPPPSVCTRSEVSTSDVSAVDMSDSTRSTGRASRRGAELTGPLVGLAGLLLSGVTVAEGFGGVPGKGLTLDSSLPAILGGVFDTTSATCFLTASGSTGRPHEAVSSSLLLVPSSLHFSRGSLETPCRALPAAGVADRPPSEVLQPSSISRGCSSVITACPPSSCMCCCCCCTSFDELSSVVSGPARSAIAFVLRQTFTTLMGKIQSMVYYVCHLWRLWCRSHDISANHILRQRSIYI